MAIIEDLRNYFRRQRRYASFREAQNKGLKELSAVRDLIEAMRRTVDDRLHSPEMGPDPNGAPDCIALDTEERRVALEVRELVSQEAVVANQHATSLLDAKYADWRPEGVITEVDSILRQKDAKAYAGGPYVYIAVVIHTDEPTIDHDTYSRVLRARLFGPYNKVSRAYFLFSPQPQLGYSPYVSLRLCEPGTGQA